MRQTVKISQNGENIERLPGGGVFINFKGADKNNRHSNVRSILKDTFLHLFTLSLIFQLFWHFRFQWTMFI